MLMARTPGGDADAARDRLTAGGAGIGLPRAPAGGTITCLTCVAALVVAAFAAALTAAAGLLLAVVGVAGFPVTAGGAPVARCGAGGGPDGEAPLPRAGGGGGPGTGTLCV